MPPRIPLDPKKLVQKETGIQQSAVSPLSKLTLSDI